MLEIAKLNSLRRRDRSTIRPKFSLISSHFTDQRCLPGDLVQYNREDTQLVEIIGAEKGHGVSPQDQAESGS